MSDAPGTLGALGIDDLELVLRRVVPPGQTIIPTRLLLVCKFFHRTLTALATSVTLRHPPPSPIVSTRLLKITVAEQCCDLLQRKHINAFARLTQLRHLDLTACEGSPDKPLTPAALRCLSDLSVLTFLSLRGCRWVTDAAAAHLAPLTSLQHLCVSHCGDWTFIGIAHLSSLAALTYLDIAYTLAFPSPDIGVAMHYLAPLTALRHLNLSGIPDMNDRCLAKLTTLTALEHVELWLTPQTTDSSFQHLARLPALHSLVAFTIDLHAGDKCPPLPHCTALTALRHLSLRKVTMGTLPPVGLLPYVRELWTLKSLEIDWSNRVALGVLSPLTALLDLTLDFRSVRKLEDLPALPSLTRLVMLQCVLASPAHSLEQLSQLPALRHLSYQGRPGARNVRNWQINVPYDNVSLAGVTVLTALTGLELEGVIMSDVTMVHVAALGTLRRLSVRRCEGFVSDGGVVRLAVLTGLRQLELESAVLTATGLGALRGLAALSQLDLSGCGGLSCDVFQHLAEMPALQRVALPARLAGAAQREFQRWPELEGLLVPVSPCCELGSLEGP